MHAIRQYEPGPPDTLRYEQVPDPQPSRGQVRIQVEAAGVHFIDTVMRRGAEGPLPPPELPTTPGREVAGVVDELGEEVDRSWLGARVVAHLGAVSGGYAELAVAAVESVHVVPDTLSSAAAVAMIGTGRTTMGVLESADLTDDDVVLVTAAAGGMGSLLVQIGRNRAAAVVGVAGGAAKVAHVRELGATVAIDYREPGWPDRVRAALGEERGVSIVFDGVGGRLGRDAMELLVPGGRLIMFGWASNIGHPTHVTTNDLVGRGLTATWAIGPAMLRRRSLRSLEEQALAEAASGQVAPIVQRFALQETAAAHRALETRASLGKVVLEP